MSVVIMYFHSNHRIFTKMVLLHSWSRHLSFYLTYQYMSVLIIPFLYYITTYLYIYLSSFLYASNLLLIIILTSIIMLHVGPAPLLYPLCIISSPAEEKACVVIFAGLTPSPSASPTSAPSMFPTSQCPSWSLSLWRQSRTSTHSTNATSAPPTSVPSAAKISALSMSVPLSQCPSWSPYGFPTATPTCWPSCRTPSMFPTSQWSDYSPWNYIRSVTYIHK